MNKTLKRFLVLLLLIVIDIVIGLGAHFLFWQENGNFNDGVLVGVLYGSIVTSLNLLIVDIFEV